MWAAIQAIARGCSRYGTNGDHDVTGSQNNAGDSEDQGTSTLTLDDITCEQNNAGDSAHKGTPTLTHYNIKLKP